MAEPIIEIDRLGISFFTRAGEIPAVMDFSCKVLPGQAMGLVGESGCGKSTVALAVMRDLPGVGRITNGTIKFEGRDMASLSEPELRAIRGSKIAMVYQEPMASLNPTMLIGQQLMEVPLIHDKVSKQEAHKRALDIVKAVRLPDPDRIMRAYPHQLSGGQQQRVVIAMALLSNPRLLILDEPTTALDVTVEAGIVALVKDLTARSGTSSLFISHNLGLILETCDSVTVMYSGEAVETGRVGTCSARCATPIRRASSARCRCRARTRTTIRSFRFRASCRCHTSDRRGATSARAAAISSRAFAIRPTYRCARLPKGRPI